MVMTTERVWEEFHPKLKQFVLRRMPDEQSGEDILQDVFLKIHTRIDTLRNEEKLQSWIYQIARNAIADYYREHRATLELSEAPALLEEPGDDDIVNELIPSIKAMVDSLPAATSGDVTALPGVSRTHAARTRGKAWPFFIWSKIAGAAGEREAQNDAVRLLSFRV